MKYVLIWCNINLTFSRNSDWLPSSPAASWIKIKTNTKRLQKVLTKNQWWTYTNVLQECQILCKKNTLILYFLHRVLRMPFHHEIWHVCGTFVYVHHCFCLEFFKTFSYLFQKKYLARSRWAREPKCLPQHLVCFIFYVP